VARGKWLAEHTGSTLELLNLLWAEWAGLDVGCQFDAADPIADELLGLAGHTEVAEAPVLGHTAYGISRWHHGDLLAAAEHFDRATRAADAIPPGSLASMLLDLDQLRLSAPFGAWVHDVLGDLDDPEGRYEELLRRLPGDRYWALLVSNFAASGALITGDLVRAERAARKGLAGDPDGVFAFWHTAGQAYLGAAMALQGRVDEGLALFDPAWARYTAMGLRTNGLTMLASRAQALAQVGRLDEAEAAMADARREFATYNERFAEPVLLLAEAVLAAGRGDDRDDVAKRLAGAADVAEAQAARAVVARIRGTAEALGYAL
jgi:tetratricopeptide (TPR) repeat protein